MIGGDRQFWRPALDCPFCALERFKFRAFDIHLNERDPVLTHDFIKTDHRNLDSPILDKNRAACARVIEAERCGPAV